MIIKPDKQIKIKEILKRERLVDAERAKPVKITAEVIASKKAEMQNLMDTEVRMPKSKKFKKKELDKKFKKIKGGNPQTKFIETINVKIPLYSVGNHSGEYLRIKSQHEPGLIKSNRP